MRSKGARLLKNAMLSREDKAFFNGTIKERRKNRFGDPFHVLHGNCKEGLLEHAAKSEHTGIAQALEFFGFCEGAHDCLFAPGVKPPAVGRFRKRIRLFQLILPNMRSVQKTDFVTE